MGIIANILITATVAIASIIGAYNYLPLSFIEKFGPGIENLGSTITTIAATDTLRDSRSTINTNFSNLNTDKMEGSTTSVASITTLSNLVTVGALTSGSLGAGFTAVTVPRGGTGSTTLSQYQLLLGNGTGNVTTTNDGLGTSGQFLQSSGNGLPPSWETSSIDQAAAYTWTGQHNFNAGATSTSATTTSLYVSGHASTTQITTNSLGVGIATTTNNNLQVAGDIQAANLSISGECSRCGLVMLYFKSPTAYLTSTDLFMGYGTTSATTSIVGYVIGTSTVKHLSVRCISDNDTTVAKATVYVNYVATAITTGNFTCRSDRESYKTDYTNTASVVAVNDSVWPLSNTVGFVDLFVEQISGGNLKWFDASLFATGISL